MKDFLQARCLYVAQRKYQNTKQKLLSTSLLQSYRENEKSSKTY